MSDTSDKKNLKIYLLPNLITTTSMFCGFFSIIYSINGDFVKAAYAIVFAALFDLMDGRVARMTNSSSQFGAEYDSLSDLISFGLAPAILIYLWALQPFGRLGWLASFIYIACGALRLARFNVEAHKSYTLNYVKKNSEKFSSTFNREHEEDDYLENTSDDDDNEAPDDHSMDFQGLPIPMAGGIIASSVLAFTDLSLEASRSWSLLTISILLGFCMVSNFRYRSFKDLDFKKRLPFFYLVLGAFIIVIVASHPEIMLFALFLIYAVFGALFGIFKIGSNAQKRKKKRIKINNNSKNKNISLVSKKEEKKRPPYEH